MTRDCGHSTGDDQRLRTYYIICHEQGGAVRTGHTCRPDQTAEQGAQYKDMPGAGRSSEERPRLQSKLAGFGEGTACYEELRGQPAERGDKVG
ncbi:unnamed protein product [Staurois parvus]|uniref:Uncharacterized protein n=1 Tax=Staurois parvus TaxID=386267 RepID=A0ABN9AFD9_9NEOB|nr:unnamed protein product [Staurois parvus]